MTLIQRTHFARLRDGLHTDENTKAFMVEKGQAMLAEFYFMHEDASGHRSTTIRTTKVVPVPTVLAAFNARYGLVKK